MRRLFFLLLSVALLLTLSAKQSFAACSTILSSNPVFCQGSMRWCAAPNDGYCCDTPLECSALPTPTPSTPPPCVFASSPNDCSGGRGTVCLVTVGLNFDTYCCDGTPSCTALGGQVTAVGPTNPPAGGSSLTPYDPTCDAGGGAFGISGAGVKTALGCLPTDPRLFVNLAIPWSIGIGVGAAFLLGLYGALMIIISAGNPEKMQAGKELITSAISGLLLVIFAVFLLNLVGIQILKLF